MNKTIMRSTLIVGAVVAIAAITGCVASESKWGKYEVEDRRSGYTYAALETRAMQDDSFENPAYIWLDQGEALWDEADGDEGKSCASCHGEAAKGMKGVAPKYPVYDEKLGKMKNVEQQINICRTEFMKAKPFKYESNELLGMTAYVKNQSYGMPVNAKIDGDAAPFFEKGKAFFNERRGQLDMACKHCHEDNPGNIARADLLSEGQSNGFPTYRLKWNKAGSLHRRFRGCNKNIRAQPYGYGSDEYVNLELYLAWRGRGLPVESPSVRK